MNSLRTCFCSVDKFSYLELNFSNNTLYVRILKSLSYVWNSLRTSSLTSLVLTSCLVKCSNKVILLLTNFLVSVDFSAFTPYIKVYKSANSL